MNSYSNVAFESTFFTDSNAHSESHIKFNEAMIFGDCFYFKMSK